MDALAVSLFQETSNIYLMHPLLRILVEQAASSGYDEAEQLG